MKDYKCPFCFEGIAKQTKEPITLQNEKGEMFFHGERHFYQCKGCGVKFSNKECDESTKSSLMKTSMFTI